MKSEKRDKMEQNYGETGRKYDVHTEIVDGTWQCSSPTWETIACAFGTMRCLRFSSIVIMEQLFIGSEIPHTRDRVGT